MMQAISKLFIDKQDQIMQFYISHLTRNCLKKIPITKAVSIAWKLKISKNFLFTKMPLLKSVPVETIFGRFFSITLLVQFFVIYLVSKRLGEKFTFYNSNESKIPEIVNCGEVNS